MLAVDITYLNILGHREASDAIKAKDLYPACGGTTTITTVTRSTLNVTAYQRIVTKATNMMKQKKTFCTEIVNRVLHQNYYDDDRYKI